MTARRARMDGRLRLYHYTCRCCEKRIGRVGILKPHRQPMLWSMPLVWATTMFPPERIPLGLTSMTLPCDRIEVCYLVDLPEQFEPFDMWCQRMEEAGLDMNVVSRLTMMDGLRPDLWYVSDHAVRVRRVSAYDVMRFWIAADAPLFAEARK